MNRATITSCGHLMLNASKMFSEKINKIPYEIINLNVIAPKKNCN